MPKIKTEASWLQSTTPGSLLVSLKGKRMPRQRRLLAVACCRRVLDLMPDPESRRAVEVAERFGDGAATAEELEAAYLAAQAVTHRRGDECQRLTGKEQAAAWNVWRLTYAGQLCAARSGMEEAAVWLLKRARHLGSGPETREKAEQCALIRDVVGNPFRPLPDLDPRWLSWGDGAVPKLARAIYDERRWAELPVLADALEEAGCSDGQLLGHCRGGAAHARGCWAVDLILGKR
jgi:hypothetical protein